MIYMSHLIARLLIMVVWGFLIYPSIIRMELGHITFLKALQDIKY